MILDVVAMNALTGWIDVSVSMTIISCVICVLGFLCNSASLWCLAKCRRINLATRVQLMIVFGILLTISTLTLPGIIAINFSDYRAGDLPNKLQMTCLTVHSVLFQMERIVFSFIAVTRLLAVWKPQLYQKTAKVSVVVIVVVFFLAYSLVSWPLVVFVATETIDDEESQRYVLSGWRNFNLLLPFGLTILAYFFMMVSMALQRHKLKKRNESAPTTGEHVSFTIRVVLFANLLLDGPHIAIHLLEDKYIALPIMHTVFNSHLIIEPLLFVGLNPHYRRAVLHLTMPCLPHCGQPTTPSTTAVSTDLVGTQL